MDSKTPVSSDPKKNDTYTNIEAEKRAEELVAPLEENRKKRSKAVIENATVLISVLAIFLTVLLYAYNNSYCGVFNIPSQCMRIDLKSYIPAVVCISGIAAYILCYTAVFKLDKALNLHTIHMIRIFYGFFIINYLFDASHISMFLAGTWEYIVPIVLSLVIEVIVYLVRSPKKKVEIDRAKYKKTVIDNLFTRLFFDRINAPILLGMFFSVFLSAILGNVAAKTTTEYQTCTYKDEQYAVIISYDDRVLVQKAREEKNILTICTSEYTFIPKERTVFVFKKYDSVIISAKSPDESDTPTEVPNTAAETPFETESPTESARADEPLPTESEASNDSESPTEPSE